MCQMSPWGESQPQVKTTDLEAGSSLEPEWSGLGKKCFHYQPRKLFSNSNCDLFWGGYLEVYFIICKYKYFLDICVTDFLINDSESKKYIYF